MRLIDADALKEQIENFNCKDCNHYNFVRCRACQIDDALSYIDDAPTVGEWISVEDRLPDAAGYECLVCAVNKNYNQTHVFTAHTGYGEPGWWTGNVHYMSRITSPSDNRLHTALNVTHWMPLPTPPEVNRDED